MKNDLVQKEVYFKKLTANRYFMLCKLIDINYAK